jgi:serine/threonine-protein kinase
VWDVGIEPSGRFFLVMELVDGTPLASSRARFGDVPWALPLLAQVAAGLVAIHRAGVVHRDLKPSNVLVSSGGVAKIADFGVAGLLPRQVETMTDDGQPLTRTGVLLGTPQYMAPELVSGARDADTSSDIFSFGVLAYEMLSSTPAFATAPVRHRLAGEAPLPAAPLRAPGLEEAIASFIDRCLDFDPARRPDAGEIAAMLA